jgi:CRISPR type IV-associated protein Csf2
MRSLFFEGKVKALTSIAHNGGENLGITSKFRREKFITADGTVEEIPVISGNAVRGILRDRGMLQMCRSLGYGTDEKTGEVKGLSLSAFYFLFSGGSLTSAGTGLNLELARRIQRLIPLSAVFGGAVGGQIMPGKLNCGKMIPICRETVHLLPEKFRPEHPASFWDFLQEEMYVRKDDEKNENLRGMLESVQQKQLAAAGGLFGDALAPAAGKSDKPQQMMYYVETLCAGTEFYWKLELKDVTDIEFEAFLSALVAFSKSPRVGGKHNVGLGEIAIQFDSWLEIDSRVVGNGKEVSVPIGTKYAKHLQKEADNIRELLNSL